MKAGAAHKLHEAYDQSQGIGGSAVAAALGLSKFTTKRQLYDRITNPDAPRPDNRFAYWGRMLEDAIIASFKERTGLNVRRSHRTFRHPVHEFLIAHVDGLGYGFVFEAKTAGTYAAAGAWGETLSLDEITPERWKEIAGAGFAELSDDIPDDYGLQLQHYMELTRKPYAFLVVLVGGNEARLYRAERDEELYREMILPGLVKFWREHVEKGVPPELEAGDEEDVRARFPRAEDDLIISPNDMTEAAGVKLLETKAAKAELEKKEKHYRAILEEAIAEHEGMIGGDFKITWKNDPDREEVTWELVAAGYRKLIEELRAKAEVLTQRRTAGGIVFDGEARLPEDAVSLLMSDLDALKSIHTNKKKGSRRFLIAPLKKETE